VYDVLQAICCPYQARLSSKEHYVLVVIAVVVTVCRGCDSSFCRHILRGNSIHPQQTAPRFPSSPSGPTEETFSGLSENMYLSPFEVPVIRWWSEGRALLVKTWQSVLTSTYARDGVLEESGLSPNQYFVAPRWMDSYKAAP
jgi:hypothetical protein